MKKIIFNLLLSLIFVGLLTGSILANEPGMQISVDPRMELLSVVQYLSGYGEMGILTNFEMQYKEEISEYFALYKEHPAVKTFQDMSRRGFNYDAPPAVMLYLSNPPELQQEMPFTEYLITRAGDEATLEQFVAELRDFALQSNFNDFYRQHKDFYAQMIQQTEATLAGESYVQTLEGYYGMSQNSYNIVLVPLFHPGGYGPRIEKADGTYDVYNIMGPSRVNENIPYFRSKDQLRYLAWHEFGHSFVNPTTAEFSEEINQYAMLFEPISEMMGRQAYRNWQTSVNEHLVRAVTTRLAALELGEEAAAQAKLYEKGRGFAYIDALVASLERYEQNRDLYPTFKDFYPELVKVFKELASKDLGADFYLIPFDGTINTAMKNKKDVVIILPTNEADQGAEDRIHQFVTAFKNKYFTASMLVTDQEALEMDLKDKVPVVFGTVEGNLWLREYQEQLPFVMGQDWVFVDGQLHKGDNLRFITAYPSIFNPDRAIMIYTAQEAADVVNIHYVFHGPTAYVIAQGNKPIFSGNYKE